MLHKIITLNVMRLSIKTPGKMEVRITTLNITKLKITTLVILTLVKGQRKTSSKLKLMLMALNMIEFSTKQPE
jgi:hypothetical protein